MRVNAEVILTIVALVGIHTASAGVLATHESAKDLYDEVLHSEQQGRAEVDRISMGISIDEQQAQLNFQQGIEAHTELERLARAGDIDARYYTAMLEIHSATMDLAAARQNAHDSTASVLADQGFKKAVEWLKPLAERNIPQAQWIFGQLYANGQGVNQSNSNAIELWFKAAQTFLKRGDRENALTLFDMIRNADPSNPHITQLRKLLFGGQALP